MLIYSLNHNVLGNHADLDALQVQSSVKILHTQFPLVIYHWI